MRNKIIQYDCLLQGDSGGGFIVGSRTSVVVAIASATYGDCGTHPDEYTIVYNHIIWIENTVNYEFCQIELMKLKNTNKKTRLCSIM